MKFTTLAQTVEYAARWTTLEEWVEALEKVKQFPKGFQVIFALVSARRTEYGRLIERSPEFRAWSMNPEITDMVLGGGELLPEWFT